MRTGSHTTLLLLFLVLCALSALLMSSARALQAAGGEPAPEGYIDSELLPGGQWTVHDPRRPSPPRLTPGPGAGLGTAAPDDAIRLFDGTDTAAFEAGGEAIGWRIDGDALVVVPDSGSIQTVQGFGDCQLHIEWASPTELVGDGQGRGNSGVFFMGRYELQILDSHESRTYADGQAAALYGQYPPLYNVCRAPGEWQGYDVVFRRPRFDADGALVSPARMTVFHNGVLVHDAAEMIGATAHKDLARYSAHEDRLAIGLQDHHNPVRFRNIWIRDLER